MTLPAVLDAAGRRRSPATMPGYHAGRAPATRGSSIPPARRPADSPSVEEIIAVMRQAADDRHGARLRALIVVLWRRGLRVQAALALGERDLDLGEACCSCAAARVAAGARSAWTPGAGNSSDHGSPPASGYRSDRCSASSTARPAAGPGRAPGSGSSSAGPPPRRACGGASRRASCATPTPSSSPAKACRSNVIQRQLGHANLGTTSTYLPGIDTEEIIVTFANSILLAGDDGGASDGPVGDRDNARDSEGVRTGDGNDTVTGDRSDEAFATGNGNDTITPGPGNDAADAGAGDDELFIRDGEKDAPVKCGADTDTIEADFPLDFSNAAGLLQLDDCEVFLP
jgi:hypothetical protein